MSNIVCADVEDAENIISIFPVLGNQGGGTICTITGSNFINTGSLACRVGLFDPKIATWMSSTSLLCPMPISPITGEADVTVSNNNQDFTAASLTFTFTENLVFSSVTPTQGPSSGGSIVSVTGQVFWTTMWCKFDVTAVQATVQSSSSALCRSPAASSGSKSLALSNNNQDFTGGHTFTYYGVSIYLCAV